MGKGVTGAQNLQLLKWCSQFGIRVSWSILWGFPGENDSWYSEIALLLPLLYHLQPTKCIRLRYQRYSPYHKKPEKYGLKLKSASPFQDIYPLHNSLIDDLVYHFEDKNNVVDGIYNRPGIQELTHAADGWSKAWQAEQLPVLLMREENNKLLFKDTRPIAVSDFYCASNLERKILLLADESHTEVYLHRYLTETGESDSDIDAAILHLERQRLLMRLDGRIIGLALWEPYKQVLPLTEFPGGHLNKE